MTRDEYFQKIYNASYDISLEGVCPAYREVQQSLDVDLTVVTPEKLSSLQLLYDRYAGEMCYPKLKNWPHEAFMMEVTNILYDDISESSRYAKLIDASENYRVCSS